MPKLRIELSAEDVKKIVLEHLVEEYRLDQNSRRGHIIWSGVSLTWTDAGGLIFERDDSPTAPTTEAIPPDWKELVNVDVDDNNAN